MKTSTITVHALKLIALLCLFTLTGCIKDDDAESRTGGPGDGNGEVPVAVRLQVPGRNMATRATSPENEVYVSTIDALVFDDLTRQLLYVSSDNFISDDDGTVTGMITLYETDDDIIIHLVANARDAIIKATLTPGKTVEEAMSTIISGCPTSNYGKLSVPFPMWGILKLQGVPRDGLSTQTCKLLRAVARVDVGLNYETSSVPETAQAQGLPNFTLGDVRLFRVWDKGRIWSEHVIYDLVTEQPERVSQPALPDGVAFIDYTDQDNITPTAESADGVSIESELYMYEHAGAADKYTAPCIIIGGIYGNDTEMCYYKVYFGGTAASDFNINILRNKRYRFNVKSVVSRGYPTVDDALNHEATDMIVVEVIDWEVTDVNMALDGQYYLRSDVGMLEFNRYGGQTQLEVTTNYPDGFSVSVSESLSDWITSITPLTGAADQPVRISLVAPELEGNVPRNNPEDYIIIRSGNLERRIPVGQDNSDVALQLQVSRNEFHFSLTGGLPYHLTNPEAKVLDISWEPATATVSVININPVNDGVPIAVNNPVGNMISSTVGFASFDMTAEAFAGNDPLRERSDIWMVMATNPATGETKSRMISVKQFDYGISLDTQSADLGRDENGSSVTITVKSTAKYKYTVSGDWTEAVANTEGINEGIEYGPAAGEGPMETHTLRLIPKVYSPEAGTPAAGTTYEPVITFETVDPISNQAPQVVKVKRVVKAYYELVTYNVSNNIGEAVSVDLDVKTNARFGFTGNLIGSGVKEVGASAWGTKTMTMTTPANTTWQDRDVEVRMYYYDEVNALNNRYITGQITQRGYYFDSGYPRYEAIEQPYNKSFTFHIVGSGYYPRMNVMSATLSGTTYSKVSNNTPALPASKGGTSTTETKVSVPVNTTGAPRMTYARFQHNTNDWTNIPNPQFDQESIGYLIGSTYVEVADRTQATHANAGKECSTRDNNKGWRLPYDSELISMAKASIGYKNTKNFTNNENTRTYACWGWSPTVDGQHPTTVGVEPNVNAVFRSVYINMNTTLFYRCVISRSVID